MSRTTVRAAIADSFSNADIDGVLEVRSGKGRSRIAHEAPNRGVGVNAKGAYLRIEIPHDQEIRVAIGGQKRLDYEASVHVRYFTPSKAEPEDAEAEFDLILDDLRSHIRTDRTLRGQVFQSGEGSTPVATDYGELQENNNGAFELSAVISFLVTDFINA